MRALALLLVFLGCQAPPPARPLPVSAVDSTYQVLMYDAEGELMGAGTGWVAGYDDTETLVVTAGHVCDPEVGSYMLVARNGDKVEADVRRVSKTVDLCLMSTGARLGGPLPLARAMPDYGDAVGYVGAPAAIWGGGVAPLYMGYYAGGELAAIPTSPGASGSAILSSSGVVGVLVAVDRRYHHLTYFVPLDELRAFLAE